MRVKGLLVRCVGCRSIFQSLLISLVLVSASLSAFSLGNVPRLKSVHAFPNLSFEQPLFITAVPDRSNRLCVVEQGGKLYFFENNADVKAVQLVLDISDRIFQGHMEEGLLGLAFPPDYQEHPSVILMYSAKNPRRNVLARFTLDGGNNRFMLDSEQILLEIAQPYGNHNGGMIAFGPDGSLYVSLGDGGGAGDRQGNAQDLSSLLGKILRLQVSRRGKPPYQIPSDNPFVKDPTARGEIWAYGLRNVWRFSFDRVTGTFWAGDVGQDRYEEIDIIRKAGNYGWNLREGFHSFEGGRKTQGQIEPVWEHGRSESRSITGGYVYRGSALSEIKGYYCYGDFITGRTWFLKWENGKVTEHHPGPGVPLLASFGEDAAGELYMCSYNGKIYTFKSR